MGTITAASTSGGLFLEAPLVSNQDSQPIISVNTATTSTLGVVQPDGTTITISNGIISAAGGSGGVTAVTGTAPIASSGGTTPNITVATATASVLGVVKPDGSTITITAGVISATGFVTGVTGTAPIVSSGGIAPAISVNAATNSTLGVVRPDGTTVTISGGVLSVPTATTGALGLVKPDGTTITISAGVISAAGSSGAMVRLAQQVLGSAAASVTFSGISGAYTHLMLTITGRSSTLASGDAVNLAYNADTTAANYAGKYFSGTGTSPTVASPNGSEPGAYIGNVAGALAVANAAGSMIVDIIGYSGNTFIKFGYSRCSDLALSTTFSSANMENYTSAHAWNNTAAINAIVLTLISGANFVAGSTFTLYGIS